MAESIYPAIETDPTQIEEIGFDYLRSAIPGWEPTGDGDLVTADIQVGARIAAEVRDVASDVPRSILRHLGESVFGVPAIAAAPALVSATVTMRDDAGYTLPAGTEVLVQTAGDDGVTFVVVEAVTVPPTETASSSGAVTLRAAEGREGEVGNGLTSANEATTIRALEFVEQLVLVGTSSGGVDAESDEAYEARLIAELGIQSPAPILPRDFAILARRVPGVARALALNLYDPVTRTSDNERMVTVAVVDADGEPLGRSVKEAVAALLEAMREVNWRCPVIDPTYTRVDVEFTATAMPGEDPAVVQAAAIAAVEEYLSPAGWGTIASGEQPDWHDEPDVRLLELAWVLNQVPGLRHVERLELAEGGARLGTADVPLDGPAALPRAGEIRGTVS